MTSDETVRRHVDARIQETKENIQRKLDEVWISY